MLYQSFVVVSSNVNLDIFPQGMPNSYSTQWVDTEEIHPLTMNDDGVEDQEPEYRGPYLNFHIPAQPVHPNLYASIFMVPHFPNNVALHYAYFGAPLAPNVQPGRHTAQEGIPTAHTLNPAMMYQMSLQFMPAQNIVQPPPRVATQRVPGINQPRPTKYQFLQERICAI